MIEIKMPREMEEVKGDLISRQAVIYYIKPYIQEIITESGVDKNEHTNRILRAIINGIETMPTGKQRPCEDAISRNELLSRIDAERKRLLSLKMDGAEHIIVHHARRIIEDLPSVTPQPKIGKWIEQEGFDGDTYYDCSECGESFCLIDGTPADNLYNYCPNCGSKLTELKPS